MPICRGMHYNNSIYTFKEYHNMANDGALHHSNNHSWRSNISCYLSIYISASEYLRQRLSAQVKVLTPKSLGMSINV